MLRAQTTEIRVRQRRIIWGPSAKWRSGPSRSLLMRFRLSACLCGVGFSNPPTGGASFRGLREQSALERSQRVVRLLAHAHPPQPAVAFDRAEGQAQDLPRGMERFGVGP